MTRARDRRRYPTLTDTQFRELFRPENLPPQPWRYTLTPRLVLNLTRVADAAGQMRASPLSYYRQKELAARAKRMRILWNVSQFSTPGVPPPKGTWWGTAPNWKLYSPRERTKLLELQREAARVQPEVKALFDWADQDPLVSQSAVLRAATLYWGLTLLYPTWKSVSVVLHHEFRIGDVDANGLLMLTEATVEQHELLTTPSHRMVRADDGDLTTYFEEFSSALMRVLWERLEQLGRVQDNESHLPWKIVAPPDELDALELQAQRWEDGTPAITWSTCWPQPAHVVFEH